jgi:hypothetical protein
VTVLIKNEDGQNVISTWIADVIFNDGLTRFGALTHGRHQAAMGGLMLKVGAKSNRIKAIPGDLKARWYGAYHAFESRECAAD